MSEVISLSQKIFNWIFLRLFASKVTRCSNSFWILSKDDKGNIHASKMILNWIFYTAFRDNFLHQSWYSVQPLFLANFQRNCCYFGEEIPLCCTIFSKVVFIAFFVVSRLTCCGPFHLRDNFSRKGFDFTFRDFLLSKNKHVHISEST